MQALHPSFAIRPPLRLLSHSDTFELEPTGCFTKDGNTSILQNGGLLWSFGPGSLLTSLPGPVLSTWQQLFV